MNKKSVLFICTGNVARSQMAEGFLRHDEGDRFEVFSAGLNPSYVRPGVIEVMREVGVDISHQRSKSVDEFRDAEIDYVITVCDHANQHCPQLEAKVKRIHWSVEDPVAPPGDDAAQLDAFRRVRDDIHRRIQNSVRELRARQ